MAGNNNKLCAILCSVALCGLILSGVVFWGYHYTVITPQDLIFNGVPQEWVQKDSNHKRLTISVPYARLNKISKNSPLTHILRAEKKVMVGNYKFVKFNDSSSGAFFEGNYMFCGTYLTSHIFVIDMKDKQCIFILVYSDWKFLP